LKLRGQCGVVVVVVDGSRGMIHLQEIVGGGGLRSVENDVVVAVIAAAVVVVDVIVVMFIFVKIVQRVDEVRGVPIETGCVC